MKKWLSVLAVLVTLPLPAADPPGFVHWTAAELKAYEKKLASKMNAQKLANERLSEFGNHYAMIAHREGDGIAEIHDRDADLFVVTSGEAVLVVGGAVPGARTESPGELRGPSIEGGVKKKLGAGDIVHIPSKTPHQLLVSLGKQFTYFVVKMREN